MSNNEMTDRLAKRNKDWFEVLPLLILLVLWELLGRFSSLTGGLLPPFTAVLKEFLSLIKNGVLIDNFSKTFIRIIIGFTFGTIIGVATGIIMGWNKFIETSLRPIISILYPIPALGWLPFLMLWIGINELLPITMVFICSFFPISYNTISGIKNVDRNYIHVARTLGASNLKIIRTILFPLALPYIFTGLRLEAGMAWRVTIAAEMIAIPTGIGALMMRAESLIRMDIIIICLMILSLMTFIFEKSFILLERIYTKWKY